MIRILLVLISGSIITLLGPGCSIPAASRPVQTSQAAVGAEMGTGIGAITPDTPAVAADPAVELPAEGTGASENDEGDDEDAPLDAALELIESAREFWTAGERDRAIEALDQAYAALLRAGDNGQDKELQQQKEDLRFMISKRLLEIYAVRHAATNGTHKEIPLTMNEHVEREIRLFQTLERDFFIESYQRSGKYRDRIEQTFRDAGLPEELSWLPLIESGFKVRAMSRARALGLWQFIPSTGYKFGLKRSDWIDERLDPEKATAAAIAYLKELHAMFGDWATVLAAYNCGEGAVIRVIRQQKINYLDNFWDLYERLPRETARYYPRFLAVLAIIREPARYGFTLDPQPVSRAPFEVVSLDRPVQLSKLAERIGIDSDELAGLNPELRHQATPPGAYNLKVPPGKTTETLAAIELLPRYTPPKPAFVVHRVRRGETLSSIAMRYRTSVSRIMDVNNLRSARFLRAGQKLKIPLTRAS